MKNIAITKILEEFIGGKVSRVDALKALDLLMLEVEEMDPREVELKEVSEVC